MPKQKRLQVLFNQEDPNCEWEYVFCRNMNGPRAGGITTTKNPNKALKYYHLEWFQNHFGNYHFRVV